MGTSSGLRKPPARKRPPHHARDQTPCKAEDLLALEGAPLASKPPSSSGQELGWVGGFCAVGTVETSAVVHPTHRREEGAVLAKLLVNQTLLQPHQDQRGGSYQSRKQCPYSKRVGHGKRFGGLGDEWLWMVREEGFYSS